MAKQQNTQQSTQSGREVVDKAEAEIQLGALKEELELIKKPAAIQMKLD